jgi:hypothetical protein
MGSRKNSENLKHKSIEIQGKLAEAQDKYKQQEKELEDFRRTVGSATAQKESLAVLSKVRQRKPIPNVFKTMQDSLNIFCHRRQMNDLRVTAIILTILPTNTPPFKLISTISNLN